MDTDIKVWREGTVVAFEVRTERAREWVAEHVQLESWQWIGTAFAVEHRFAEDLIEGMSEAGLILEQ